MNIFTANQVNQVYVLKSDSSVKTLSASTKLTKSDNLGSVGIGQTADGKSIYFKHLGAGGLNRSDLIEIANIMDVKATPAVKMARKLKTFKVTLNAAALVSSNPIVGQDYILRIKFQNPIGMSPDNQYWKYGAVHVTSGMTQAQFMAKMAESINKNMSREAAQLITATAEGSTLLIKEVEQDWIRGIKQQKPLVFTVEPTMVSTATEEVIWGDVIDSDGNKLTGGAVPETSVATTGVPDAAGTVKNGKLMADYEYFYMGERADQYRMVNWPDYVPTEYLVDPTLEYDTVAIHFAYVGANHAVQKSEKDITFIVPRAAGDTTAANVGAKATSLLNAINAIVSPEPETSEP
jgi:hypothetical protein